MLGWKSRSRAKGEAGGAEVPTAAEADGGDDSNDDNDEEGKEGGEEEEVEEEGGEEEGKVSGVALGLLSSSEADVNMSGCGFSTQLMARCKLAVSLLLKRSARFWTSCGGAVQSEGKQIMSLMITWSLTNT